MIRRFSPWRSVGHHSEKLLETLWVDRHGADERNLSMLPESQVTCERERRENGPSAHFHGYLAAAAANKTSR